VEWAAWVVWEEWAAWECNHSYQTQNSKNPDFFGVFFI